MAEANAGRKIIGKHRQTEQARTTGGTFGNYKLSGVCSGGTDCGLNRNSPSEIENPAILTACYHLLVPFLNTDERPWGRLTLQGIIQLLQGKITTLPEYSLATKKGAPPDPLIKLFGAGLNNV